MRDMWILWFGCIVGIQTHVKTIKGSEITIRNLITGVDPTVDKGRYGVIYWVELFITCLHDVTSSILPDMELCVVIGPRVWNHTYRNDMWEPLLSMNVDEWCCGCCVLFWRDHHTSQTWYRCCSSSWVNCCVFQCF